MVSGFLLGMLLDVNFLPTNGVSMKRPKVKLLAGEQKAARVCLLTRHSWL